MAEATAARSAGRSQRVRERYSLVGPGAATAMERGLAEAEWYQSPVPRATMRALLQRSDRPAIRDTVLWFGLILASAGLTLLLWPSWWAAAPYLVYAALYASTSDSRWHESGHGTAFATDWMNDALYEIASFMILRESVFWRWSHVRHHSDTLVVGRDREIAYPRPPDLWSAATSFFALPSYVLYLRGLARHALGHVSPEDRAIVPESEFPGLFRRARIHLASYALVLLLALAARSIVPLLLVGLPGLFGSWLMVVYAATQHAGLAEDVLDHRLNSRTVTMNRLNRYLYWNMNYHVEHHMFPLVPFHALPRLHQAVKDDMPVPYPGILAAWRELVPAVLRQARDPSYHVKRVVPPGRAVGGGPARTEARPDAEGWVEACRAGALAPLDIVRLDVGHRTFAVYRDAAGSLFATDGLCTHGNTHLSDGLVKEGMVECAKHNGRFHLRDGSPARPPVCAGLSTYPVAERDGLVLVNVARPGGAGARPPKAIALKVVHARQVATFIKELELEPAEALSFVPGDYLQIEIPTYAAIRLGDLEIPDPYRATWQREGLLDLVATNPRPGRRNNYSLASNPRLERTFRLDVRLATPTRPGSPPGAGSSWMFGLRRGDVVAALGPFGDFHIKPTQREMVYIGGGSGMAPLRAHLSHLFESEGTHRTVSFWYGARSRQEIFYQDYFEQLARRHPNFRFCVALSSPLPEDGWEGPTGFIHEVVLREYLREHRAPSAIEYYLCGPPLMIAACTRMLRELAVPAARIAFDEF